jgi:predicted nucleotidyltransferase
MRLQEDPVIAFIVDAAAIEKAVRRIYLFGSRSKNEHSDRSDYDLGVDWDLSMTRSWGEFAGHIRDGIPTLHQLDLVRLDLCADDLNQVILGEGVLIYERQDSKDI